MTRSPPSKNKCSKCQRQGSSQNKSLPKKKSKGGKSKKQMKMEASQDIQTGDEIHEIEEEGSVHKEPLSKSTKKSLIKMTEKASEALNYRFALEDVRAKDREREIRIKLR